MKQVVLTSQPLYLVVVLSRGLLQDPTFARLCRFTDTIEVVNVHADAGFNYPDSAFYDKLRAGEMAIEWIVERYNPLQRPSASVSFAWVFHDPVSGTDRSN